MKKYFSIIRIFILSLTVFLTSCVQDDVYSTPDLQGKCQDLTPTKTIAEVKTAFANNTATITDDIIIEGYVSSSDESGNVYKTIYLQDAPENPTQGLVVSVDAVSTYTSFPQGSKVYIKLKGLAFGRYGNVLQVGYNNIDPITNTSTFGRIPEKLVANHLVRSCASKVKIVPKVITLASLTNTSTVDPLIGALVQINNAEFPINLLCNIYAPNGTTVNRQIVDPTMTTPINSRVVRNSGYASFAADQLPSGNGTFIGILSKFNSDYQFFINRVSDLNMKGARLDGSTPSCSYNTEGKKLISVSELKLLYTSGNYTQITDNVYLKAQVTANDKTGNLFKYIYVEDKTGGIRVNIDMASLYADPRFFVGKQVLINLKDLYVGSVNTEVQLGGLFNGNVGRVLANDVYKHFFPTTDFTEVVATEKTIAGLTDADVGRWIKIKDLQFINDDLGESYAGASTTSRTLEDCSGAKLSLTTRSLANFASRQIDSGKGDLYGVLTKYNGKYEVWITNPLGADFDGNRCDGSPAPVFESIFNEDFSGALTNNWTAVSVLGTAVWNIQQFGNPKPCVVMSGNGNEDWLISKPITLAGYKNYYLSFETDGRASVQSDQLEVYVTDNYTGSLDPKNWTKLNPTLDSDMSKFAPFVNSGKLDISNFAGKNVVVAFKYTSTDTASATWELDNVKVRGRK